MTGWQPSLLGRADPEFDHTMARMRRIQLSPTSWIDTHPGWLSGHDTLFEVLRQSTSWRSSSRIMYQREVDVPRLLARLPDDGPGHPVIDHIRDALSDRYGRRLGRASMALYRDGRDSVAWHRDGELSETQSLVALVSVGEPRRFLIRPLGGRTCQGFRVGWGDLVVLGGATQGAFEHCIPKTACAGPRIVILLRWTA